MGINPVREALTTEYVQTLLKIKAGQLARRPEFRKEDPGDIKQDLIEHVLRQADNFDPSRAGVNTFITRIVETAVAMLIRRQKRQKRAGGHHAMSLEGTVLEGDGRETSMANLISEADLRRRAGGSVHDDQGDAELSTDIVTAIHSLPPALQDIALRLIAAKGREVPVADDLGISRRQVRKAVTAIREHFRDHGWEDLGPAGHPARR